MEEACEKECVFEESVDIDFDYEFDVAKYFDFLRPETVDDVEDSERWFNLAQGHPPSPILLKLGLVAEEFGGSDTSSPKYAHSITNEGGESEVLSRDKGKKGPALLRSKSMNQPCLLKSSRLLQPTASLLAKQNHQISVRDPGRFQKPGSPLKSPGYIAATKRQKLEHGYLLKVAHLKHQTSFSHKVPKKVGFCDVNCHARPKVTVPKEPKLETANRAQRHRSKDSEELGRNTKILEPKLKRTQSLTPEIQGGRVNHAKGATQKGKLLDTKKSKSFNATMYEKSDHTCKTRAVTKKSLSNKGDIGALQNSKLETAVLKECKRTSCKKQLQTPLTELFSQLSLDSEDQSSSVLEDDEALQTKDLKKNVRCTMKENKNANRVTEKSTRCCLKQSQTAGGRMIDIGS
ncbi:uncharacterized protein LOC141656570 [Silene latifolia]|uniref:uncharacterized protein LOC141656570 n=1 Tax=Silene latifolia TaxID=37657 RepID=UPI003D774012